MVTFQTAGLYRSIINIFVEGVHITPLNIHHLTHVHCALQNLQCLLQCSDHCSLAEISLHLYNNIKCFG